MLIGTISVYMNCLLSSPNLLDLVEIDLLARSTSENKNGVSTEAYSMLQKVGCVELYPLD